MKIIKLNIIKSLQLIVIVAVLTSAKFVGAQDLIKDTRSGVQPISYKKDIEPNNIAKKVQETLRHTESINVSAFNLSEGQQGLVAKNKSHVEDAVYLTYNKGEVAKIVKSSPAALNLQIPVTENKNIQLELIKNDFTANGFKITTSDGDEFDISNRALFYKGIVKGYPKSIVGISIFDGRISGVISDEDGNYNLGTFENKEDQLVLYNSNLLKNKSEKNCGVDELRHRIEQERNQSNPEASSLKTTNSNTCDSDDCVGIYYEVASSFYNERGSKAAVIEYLTNIFNNAAIVFDNEDIKICISHIFIWTSGDNYVEWDEVNNSRAVQLEQKFAPNLMNYDFPGNIAFLIYHHPSGDGLAWLDGDPLICVDNTISGYGALGVIGLKGDAQDFPNPSRDVQTFVHEKGHTFGSPHTHACEWTVNGVPFQAIDGCANTEPHQEYNPVTQQYDSFPCSAAAVPISAASLMSYCSGQDIPLSNGFGPLPGQLMRDNYNLALANGCLDVENNDDIFSQYPFINTYVNENNCTSEIITVYNKWNIDWLLVETPNSSRLYRGDTGQLWCSTTASYDCVASYGLGDPIAHWRCCDADGEEPPTSCDNDPVLSQYPVASIYVNENTCTSEKITVYNRWSIDWLFIETPNWTRLYRGDTGQLWCTGTHCASAYGLTNPIANWECCDGESEPESNSECDNDPVLSQYSVANTYVNENTCTSEKITVYNKWSIDWLFIETPNWSRLYRNDTGQLWCSTTANYDCVSAYGLTNPIANWECCDSQLKEETLTQEDFLIFPNPNNGVFNLRIPGSLQEDITAEIYSIDGKQLRQIELNGDLQQRIDLTGLSSGLYLIRIVSDSYNATQKFTIR